MKRHAPRFARPRPLTPSRYAVACCADVRDPYLPDHDAFVRAEPPTGRVIVIAPTRAACETIELARAAPYRDVSRARPRRARARAGARRARASASSPARAPARRSPSGRSPRDPPHHGAERRRRQPRARSDAGDADAGTSSSSRPASRAAGSRRATSSRRDTLVVDEIHQTSAELELCLALGKRVGCRFIWLSATVDPAFYARYLDSADVLEVFDFDPAKAAQVKVVRKRAVRVSRRPVLCSSSAKQRRGVALFLPTRRGVEEAAEHVRRDGAAHQHGVLPRRRADPHHPAVPRGRRAEAVLPRDDRGRPERAQRARARHRGHRRHAVLQRHRSRAQRAHAGAPRRERDPADGGARARARRGRTRVHPLATATSSSKRCGRRSRSSSSPATRSASR